FDDEIDYTKYDNDCDGDIDNLYLIWAGSDLNQVCWGFQISGGGYVIPLCECDGLTLDSITLVPYSWGGPDNPLNQDVTDHETGHLLGLPDFYDYNSSIGTCGGLGGFDLMDGNGIDHNCFSKYLLDWIDPHIITEGDHDVILRPSSQYPDAIIIMPEGSDN